MDILSAEILEKLISPKDITTFVVIWFFIKNRVKDHFNVMEASLATISKDIASLKDAIVKIERNHSEKISELSQRVERLESDN